MPIYFSIDIVCGRILSADGNLHRIRGGGLDGLTVFAGDAWRSDVVRKMSR